MHPSFSAIFFGIVHKNYTDLTKKLQEMEEHPVFQNSLYYSEVINRGFL